MFYAHILLNWLDSLKTSLPFALSVPIFIGTGLAALTAHIEEHLMAPVRVADRHDVIQRRRE
jgi:hypothetical protein